MVTVSTGAGPHRYDNFRSGRADDPRYVTDVLIPPNLLSFLGKKRVVEVGLSGKVV